MHRLIQAENAHLLGKKDPEVRILPTFPPEKLDGFTQERLQRIGDRALEVVCMHLGIDLDDLEVFQDMLVHLNDQSTGRKDKGPHFGEAFKSIIKPQMKALTALVQERLHPADWKVEMSSFMIVGDMTNIIIKSRTKDLTINLFERGFQIDSPDLEISWNIYPGARDSSSIARSKDTHITAYQRANELGLPLPDVKIQAEPTVPGDGVLQLSQTDMGREGVKPTVNEHLSPKRLLSQATYNKSGKMRYLRLLFPVPGQPRGLRNNIVILYDFREEEPKTGVLPARSKFATEDGVLDLPLYPEITVENGVIHVEFAGVRDSFPLQTHTAIEVAEHLSRALKRHFPAKRPFPSLSSGQE
jgi:hypothetical protein